MRMGTNVLEYLESTVKRLPDKEALISQEGNLTFRQLYDHARSLGSWLQDKGMYGEPVVVFMRKHPNTVAAFFGVIYAGCYYVPLDEEMPRHRIELILGTLNPRMILCDAVTQPMVRDFDCQAETALVEDCFAFPANDTALADIRRRQLDVDPIYIVFTSGSTGVPKGVTACHRSVLDYVEALCEVMDFREDTVFGNQTPLYFDACLKELYPTMKYGASTVFIPHQLFMFPVKLVEFLNQYRVNTICWVVSALTMISAFRTFDKVKPKYLRLVAFASEVFPIKQFRLWRAALPEARFINLYGPTETTGVCCYYEVDRDFPLDEAIPIGQPFRNREVILLDENNRVPPQGEPGEICIRGTALTLGYYRNPEVTSRAFVQNPLNDRYPELIYRTGDLAKYNDRGELVFLSRKDYQIKHMGHRIELGEIETIVNMQPDVKISCCLFDKDRKKIVLFYVGDLTAGEMSAYIRQKLPRYMVPNVIRQLDTMPLTPNGKIDRSLLNTMVS